MSKNLNIPYYHSYTLYVDRCACTLWRVQCRLLVRVCTDVVSNERHRTANRLPFPRCRVTGVDKITFRKKSPWHGQGLAYGSCIVGGAARIEHKRRTRFEDGPVDAVTKTHVIRSIFPFLLATPRTKRLLLRAVRTWEAGRIKQTRLAFEKVDKNGTRLRNAVKSTSYKTWSVNSSFLISRLKQTQKPLTRNKNYRKKYNKQSHYVCWTERFWFLVIYFKTKNRANIVTLHLLVPERSKKLQIQQCSTYLMHCFQFFFVNLLLKYLYNHLRGHTMFGKHLLIYLA